MNESPNQKVFLSFDSHKMRLLVRFCPITDRNDSFPYPFIYLKPEKGTPLGRSLPIQAIILSTSPQALSSSQSRDMLIAKIMRYKLNNIRDGKAWEIKIHCSIASASTHLRQNLQDVRSFRVFHCYILYFFVITATVESQQRVLGILRVVSHRSREPELWQGLFGLSEFQNLSFSNRG